MRLSRLGFAIWLLVVSPAARSAPVPPAVPAVPAGTSIKGQVLLKNPPAPVLVPAAGVPPACAAKGPVVSEDVIVNPKNGGLKNVVVHLRPDTDNRRDVFPPGTVPATATVQRVIDSPCCQFEPRVTAARAGDNLVITNTSRIAHNAQSSEFNIPILPPFGRFVSPNSLEAQRPAVLIACNIHPWMHAYIRVFDHPWFAVTDDDGKFEITNVPAGKYRIVYWHENGNHKGRKGILGTTLEIKAGAVVVPVDPLDFEFPPK